MLLLCLAIVLHAGCQTLPEPTPDPVADLPPPQPPRIDAALLADLLYRAELALAREHIAYPADGSALALYQEILSIEAGQEDAERGLEQIVEKYINMAMEALSREQYASARSMLARARLILPDHPSIKPTEAQIRLLSEATKETLRLAQTSIEDPQTVAALTALGNVPDGFNCRFTIAAKNDAQGRWIYKTLSRGAISERLRAQIKIRLPAGVERLCFPT